MGRRPTQIDTEFVRAADRVRFGIQRGVSRVENGFDWREGRVVKERVTALDALRLARAEIACGSVWTSRFVRDHKIVGPGRFGLGDREGFLLRYYRESSRVRPWKAEKNGTEGITKAEKNGTEGITPAFTQNKL